MKNKRLLLALISGAVLGVLCIVGMGKRFGFDGNEIFLASAWFNRVLMGLVIGIAGDITFEKGPQNILLRGAFFGLIVSGSWYLATGLRDVTGFLAGIVYGIIIDYIATKYSNVPEQSKF